jgi:hypothetical protein
MKYNDIWERHLENNYFPTYFKESKEMEYEEFKFIIHNDIKATNNFIHNFLAGDVYVIKGVLSKGVATQLKEEVYQYGKTTDISNLRADKKIPNYHYKSGGGEVVDGYQEFAHSYYFWRWNPDELRVFDRIDGFWDNVKILNGLGPNGLKNNTPEDGVIDRVQILHYPINVGKITAHCDVARWQKTNVAISLTERSVDYKTGGLYCLNKDDEKVDVEQFVEAGDAILWIPTVFHGVDEPTTGIGVNWENPEGRWQLLAQAVQSWAIKDRVVSISYENFKKDRQKVLEEYLFNDKKENFNLGR